MSNESQTSVYQKGQTPSTLGEAYRPFGRTDFQFQDFLLNQEKSKVEEVHRMFLFSVYSYKTSIG